MKLYWRKKIAGRWTWRPVVINGDYKEFHRIMDALDLSLWDIETMWRDESEE